MSLFMNRVPLSLISLLGIPNRVMKCSRMKFIIVVPVAFFKGMATTHFVKYSAAAKVSSPFLQHALCSFVESSEKSEGQEKGPLMTVDVATPYQEKALPQGADTSSLACSYFSIFMFFVFLPFDLVCFCRC